MPESSIDNYARTFESLSADRLNGLLELLHEQVRFKDPFNDLSGRHAVRSLFEHMYQQYPLANFEVTEITQVGSRGFIQWLFTPDPDRNLTIEGVSRVAVSDNGLITEHIDYWDSASELFAKLPMIGRPTRWLLSRLALPH